MKTNNPERGIGMIEVAMASFILIVALLGAAMAMVQGISAMFIVQEQLIAKQKAREALESVFTARSTQNITFDQIKNVSSAGIFQDGFQAIRGTGGDGIANTGDESADPIETITFAGKDGLLGTGDDETRTLTSFERKITINNVLLTNGAVDPDVRQILVEVRFKTNSIWRTVQMNSYISRFS